LADTAVGIAIGIGVSWVGLQLTRAGRTLHQGVGPLGEAPPG
jgi:hypothetical protein